MDRRIEDGEPPELVVTDVLGNVLRVGVPGWTAVSSVEAGEPLVGRVDGLRLPSVVVTVAVDGTFRHTVTDGSDPYTATGPVTLNVDAPLRTDITVPDGRVRIEPTGTDEAVRVRLPDGCRVEFTFRSRVDDETPEIVVPPTPDGLATALSTAHLPITERSPDRTWPSLRPQTASVSLGDRTHVPVPTDGPSSVEITAPPTPDALLPLAPLAAYLRASVTVETGAAVRIATSETAWRIDPPSERAENDPQRAYERAVQDHLRRVFWLDCLAREAGAFATGSHRSDLLETHGLSAERLYDASISDRLAAYDAVAPTEVRETFPAWHYAVTVPPTTEAIELVGHRLHQLPLVHVAADAASVDVRSEPRGGAPELIEPRATPARTHAWASDGVPVGGWKLLDGGVREPARSSSDPLRFVVVVNDGASADEYVAASDHYGRREDLNVTVRTERDLQTAALARVLEGEADLVHVVGHHDGDGLVCPDGSLGPDQLDSTNVRTFFLNACGSYPIGKRLAENGAQAGVVTTMAVLDETAATIGRRWSRLLAEGWPVVTALDRAQTALDGVASNHTVIGDGTVVLTQFDGILPPVVSVTRVDAELWRVELLHDHPLYHGARYRTDAGDGWSLLGDETVFTFETAELRAFLDEHDAPVTVDGEFYWPEQRAWLDDT